MPALDLILVVTVIASPPTQQIAPRGEMDGFSNDDIELAKRLCHQPRHRHRAVPTPSAREDQNDRPLLDRALADAVEHLQGKPRPEKDDKKRRKEEEDDDGDEKKNKEKKKDEGK